MLYLASLVLIILLLTISGTSKVISPLYNLYLVPILLAGATLNRRDCILIGLLGTVASSVTAHGWHLPPTDLAWAVLGVRGAFYLSLGYLAAIIAARMNASTRNWQSLVDITRAINTSLDFQETLKTITQKAVELSSADACAIRLLNQAGTALDYAESFGLSDHYLGKGKMIIAEHPLARQILSGEEVLIKDVRKARDLVYRTETMAEGITAIMGIPLRTGDNVIGQLNLYQKRSSRRFNRRDYRIANAFAEQAAIAIHNARLYASVRKNYLDTVRALTRAVEARDSLTHGHSERVAALAARMGMALHLSPQDMETLEFGALLHDVGKISLDDNILTKKTSRYSLDEKMLLEMHPMVGRSILDAVDFLKPVIPIVLYHHEHWDGSGYPEGLLEEEIPLLARVIGVANSFDAIMYRTLPFPLTTEDTLDELRKLSGTAFDPALISLLEHIYALEGKSMLEVKNTPSSFHDADHA